jgi:hypothetical protein
MANELTFKLTFKSSRSATQDFQKRKKSSAGFIGLQIYELMREERANDCHTNWMRLLGRTLDMQLHMQALATLLERKFRSAA